MQKNLMMSVKKMLQVILVCVALTSCEKNRFYDIEIGMNQQEVLEFAGNPVKTEEIDGNQIWWYEMSYSAASSAPRVVFDSDGMVIEVSREDGTTLD